MEQNEITRDEKRNRKPFVTALVSVLIAALAAFVLLPITTTKTYAKEVSASSWTDLESKIKDADDGDTIVITDNIVAKDHTITLDTTKTITIKGKDGGVKIMRDGQEKANNDFPMFTVNDGNIIFGENLTLTGKTGSCEGGTDATKFTLSNGNEYLGIAAKTNKTIIVTDKDNAIEFEFENGQLKYTDDDNNTFYLDSDGVHSTFIFHDTARKPALLKSVSGSDIASVSSGTEYVLWDGNWSGYVTHDNQGFYTDSNPSNAYKLKATSKGSDESTSSSQTCPDSTGCKIWRTNEFTVGTEAEPKGFFVQVKNNGTATLGGATFTDFITGPGFEWTAPVAVRGENANFNIEKGFITNNSVGYNADDAKSKEGADEIKTYIEKTIGVDDKGKNKGVRNTAGAVIYTQGAKGNITGGTIQGNRADTGAIAILGKGTDVQMNGGTISNNVGIHYGGAAYVYDGAFLGMGGGTMDSNYAWNKGGAVYVSDEKYGTTKWMQPDSTEKVGNSHFAFGGGSLTNNFAVNRGGAIYVESNGVVLTGGTISGNESRSLGGAIYVAGDGIQRMYQLYVSNGCITGNHAVESDTRLDKFVSKSPTDECEFNNTLSTEGPLEGDNKDYRNYAGYGGGLWLCSFGGNATFGYQEGFNVIIDGNDAVDKAGRAGTQKGGQDIKLRPTRPGEGSAINVIGNADANNNLWVNETTGKNVVINQTYTGPLPITNNRNDQACDSALQITNNMARVGGGIAANGTVIFGPAQDVYRIHTRLDIKKTWDGIAEADREVITLSLAFKDEDGTVYPLEGYEYTLDGIITPEDEITENTSMWESDVYQAAFGLPLVYQKADGTVVPVFTFTDPDDSNNKLDPSKPEQLKTIWQHFKDGKLTDNDAKLNFDLVVTEKIEGHEASEKGYVFSAEDVKFTSKATEGTPHVYYDKGKNELAEMKTNVLELSFTQDVKNKKGEEEKPEIEKYVNQAVHSDIDFDEVFTYDIHAYITKDAKEVVITDTLNPYLDFEKYNAEGTWLADDWFIQDIGPTNNHEVAYNVEGKPTKHEKTATVTLLAKGNNKPSNNGFTVTGIGGAVGKKIEDVTLDGGKTTKKMTVTISDASNVNGNDIRGHWVKIRFNAKIKEGTKLEDLQGAYQEVKGTEVDSSRKTPNTGNAPVNAGATHTGVPNKAEYIIDNKADYSDTSNTVTVKPETVKISAKKLWDKENATEWPEGAKITVALKASNSEDPIEEKTITSFEEVTFTEQPKLEDVEYTVEEVSVEGIDSCAPVGEPTHQTVNGVEVWTFTNTVGEIEKYVKKDVDATLKNPKEKFTFDVIGYVAENATSVTIKDNLVAALELVEDSIKVQAQPTNNHQVGENGTVNQAGTEKITTFDDTTQGKNIVISITDETELAKLRGNWVQLTFDATLSQAARDAVKNNDEEALRDLGFYLVNDNGTVQGGVAEHDGFINNAVYSVGLPNEGTVEDESNTVTVEPSFKELTIEKQWQDENGDALNADLPSENVSVEILADGQSMNPKETVELKASENWKATVKDLPEYALNADDRVPEDAEPIEYTIKEISQIQGYTSTINGMTVVNKKDAEIPDVTAELKAKKVLLDADKNDTTGGEYTFKLSAVADAPMPANYNAETGINVAASSEGTFGTITYPAETKTYKYTVTEVADTTDTTTVYDGTTVNVTVSVKQDNDNNWISEVKYKRADDQDTTDDESKATVATFVNKKIKDGTATAHLEAQKILYNKSIATNMTVPEGAFTFKVTPEGTAPALVTDQKSTGTDGKAVFENITFNAEGEYKYKIEEVIPDSANQVKGITYDKTKVTATVRVEVDETNTDRTVVKFKPPTVTYEREDDTDTEDVETDTNKFVNKTNDTEIEITKVWENADEGDKDVEKFKTFLKLFKKAASGTKEADWAEVQNAVPEVVGDPATDNWTVKYGSLARYLAGTLIEYVYSVVETAPEGFVASYKQAEAQTATENERALDGATITNVKPEIEKYVNKDVHADLETYDKAFIYDVIAYVPKDATEITITDKLDSKLEFVSDEAAIEASAVWIEPSNHKADSVEVAEGGRSVEETGTKVIASATIADDQTLTVNVKDIGTEEDQQAIGGKSVRITFTAKIKANADGTYTVLKDSDFKPVPTDAPVETQLNGDAGHKAGDHKGIKNQASYTIKTSNDAEANPKYPETPSNEVTVVPETIKFAGTKSWTGEFTDENKDGWPDEVTSVTFNLIKVKGETRETVDTITLTSEKQSDNFKDQPKLEGVTYEVEEAAVTGYMVRETKSETDTTTDVTTTTITNEKKPEIEKYVEKDVHADLVEFDKVFTYDVIAYVPTDATAITITDPLNTNLKFVSTAGEIAASTVAIAKSDHKAVTGSVATKDTTPVKATATINESNLLTVRVENIGTEEGQQDIGGESVRITFKAKIKDEIRDLTAFTENVTKDTPVITLLEGEAGHKAGDHTGIKNQAKYTIEIDNEATSKPEYTDVPSNEVTVIPEMAKFAGTKSWTGEFTDEDEDGWPDEVESVTFNLVKVEGNNRTVVETKTINKDTENRTVRFADQPKLENVSYEVEEEFSTKYSVAKTESATGTDGVTKVTITNKPGKPEIEKYVNDDVHADLGEFDKVFKYDIMAYVTNDATSVVIEDPLTTALEFAKVPADGTESTVSAQKAVSAAETIKAVVTKTSNDHKAGGSVSGTDSDEVSAEKYNAEIVNGNTLKVTINNIDDNTGIRGKWVQITFYAKYTDAVIAAATAGDFTQVSRNGAVISEKYPNVADDAQEGKFAHEGTVNKASYTITAGNRSYDKATTNEVTVKPDKAKIEVAKTWGNNRTEWPADIDSVTVALFAKKGETVTEVKGTVAEDGSFTAGGNAQATYELNEDKKQITITGLPKLIGTEYYAQEIKVDDKAVNNGTKYGQVKIGLVEYIVSYIDALKDKETDNERYSTTVNNEKIEVEKYVNNNVHADLVEFDKVFKYDVLAYVSKDATEVTITDSLVSALEFAKPSSDLNAKAQKAANAAEAQVAVTVKDSNNHEVGGTVAQGGDTVAPTSVDISNNTLTVKFANVDENTGIRGKWVQVTFYAKYTDAIIEAANIGDTAKVTNNGAVLGGITPHDGTGNEAHYTMKVGNDATVDIDTNKVTVKPETTKVYVKKQVQDILGNAKTVWPSGLSVKANVYKNTEGSTSEPEIVQMLTINGLEAVGSKVLPKLKGVTYTVDEVQVPAGYEKVGDVTGKGTEADPYVITNRSTDKPEIEKYVNKNVTWDFENFDQVFTYDVMAYVTMDADKLTVTDELNAVLEFANPVNLKIANMGTTNDHKSVVRIDGTDITASANTANAQDGKVTVEIEDLEAKGLRGHWIRVSFDAQIKADVYDQVATLVANKDTNTDKDTDPDADTKSWLNVENNGLVDIDTVHNGVPNKASYVITTDNGGTHKLDSNTVTVEPKTTEIKVSKDWLINGQSAAWPKDASVVVNLTATDKDGKDALAKTGLTDAQKKTTLTSKDVYTFANLPKLDGVTYGVKEGEVTNGGDFTKGTPELKNGVYVIANTLGEQPTIEKYVAKDVHYDVDLDETFTYDIIAYATKDATKLTITDKLVKNLEFVSTSETVKVVDLGTENNHKADGAYTGANADATVSKTVETEIDGYEPEIDPVTKTLEVIVNDVDKLGLQGHYIRVTFDAKLTADASHVNVTNNGTVASDKAHEGVENQASYIVDTAHAPYDKCDSNVVTVKPKEDTPEIEKYVNKKDATPEDRNGTGMCQVFVGKILYL